MKVGQAQIEKNRVTKNFIETIKSYFKTNDIVKISVLKSAREEKIKMKEYSDALLEKLGDNYTVKIIGFKIILKNI